MTTIIECASTIHISYWKWVQPSIDTTDPFIAEAEVKNNEQKHMPIVNATLCTKLCINESIHIVIALM